MKVKCYDHRDAKDVIDAGYTDVQILLDRNIWYVLYCHYLELDDV